MIVTIDTAGRIVVPKSLRDALGLRPGAQLEISARDGRLELEPQATPMELVCRDGVWTAVTVEDLPTLTTDHVRAVLEQTRA